jgi:pyrophosphatase PpaX
MIKGIIFDFDGTLGNTLPVIFACYDHSTEKILGKKADRAPFIETFGQPLIVCLTSVFGEEKGRLICDEYRAYQEIHHDELIRSFPRVKETLEVLQQMNIPMAVVTSKSTATCLRGAHCLGIENYFVTVIGSDAVTHPKPDAEPARMALEKLGTLPEETLCVGDAPFDIMSGRGAGCITAAVEYTQVAREKFAGKAAPDYWLKDLTEIVTLFEKNK